MRYAKANLQRLWDRIASSRTPFWGSYVGLKRVRFTIPIDEFKELYRQKVNTYRSGQVTTVMTNLEDALIELNGKDIQFHHLSCAAETGYDNNAALCIHYQSSDESISHAMAIPGINYIPTAETLEKLKALHSQRKLS